MPDPKEGLAEFDEFNPYTNPDVTPKSTLGFRPDPMADKAKEYFREVGENLDEATRRLTVLPRRPDARGRAYGEIWAPGFADTAEEGMQAIMLGPIKVEEALGTLAMKALPASVMEKRLLEKGASKAELETRGVSDWLRSKGTEPVNPLALMKHLDDNPYQLNEIVKGSKMGPVTITQPQQNRLAELWSKVDAADAINRPKNISLTDTEKIILSPQEYTEYQNLKRLRDASHISEVSGVTKFSQWQTPGGTNYREILMQAPVENKPTFRLIDSSGKVRKGITFDSEEAAAIAIRNAESFEPGASKGWTVQETLEEAPSKFTGGHWDEPNVVAHVRVNDRTLPSGEKALHVEEWQSDWSLQQRGADAPPHLLVENWQDLMARRTLKEAVDGGYDRLTWTTGQQQADRYDLAKHIESVNYKSNLDGSYYLQVMPKGGTNQDLRLPSVGSAEELPSIVGKDLARKIVAGEGKGQGDWKEFSNLDLKVGGEWATKLYDESMVNRFNKIGKRYGVKVEDVPIKGKTMGNVTPAINHLRDSFQENIRQFPSEKEYYAGYVRMVDNMESYINNGEYKKAGRILNDIYEINTNTIGDALMDIDKALKRVEKISKKIQTEMIHSIKITPEMKESIGTSKFHPFADLPGPRPKVLPAPVAVKKVDLHAEAATLDPTNPVRYIGEQFGHPMYQQDDPGVGSFMVQPGETLTTAFARARKRYGK